jgi:hypothetical protein
MVTANVKIIYDFFSLKKFDIDNSEMELQSGPNKQTNACIA